MTQVQNVSHTNVGHDADARIEQLLSMMSERDFEQLKSSLQERFGLEYEEADSHPHNIKTIITGKKIVFSKDVSPSSRTFGVGECIAMPRSCLGRGPACPPACPARCAPTNCRRPGPVWRKCCPA